MQRKQTLYLFTLIVTLTIWNLTLHKVLGQQEQIKAAPTNIRLAIFDPYSNRFYRFDKAYRKSKEEFQVTDHSKNLTQVLETLHELKITEEIQNYLSERLNDGKTLATLAKANVSLPNGRLFLSQSKEEPRIDLSHLQCGGLINVKASYTYVANLIAAHISAPEYLAIFEEEYADATDGWIRTYNKPEHLCTYENDVFIYVLGPSSEEKEIKDAIQKGTSGYQSLGFLSRIEKSHSTKLNLDDKQLNYIATKIEAIIFLAFDYEGFLIWLNQPS